MKYNIILSEKRQPARIGVLPPILPSVGTSPLRRTNIADRSIEPDVKHFAFGTLERHRHSPVEIASDRAVLESCFQPTARCLEHVWLPVTGMRLDIFFELLLKSR